ncbi:MAG: hypothetical protein H0W29_12970 [Gemmatimonadales bacterium]|nr:hypothetical protein [Gemmatimonadales bacterium]
MKIGDGRAGRGGREIGARTLLVASALVAPLCGGLTAPIAAQTSLTIYNDGRVLVRRELPVAVPKGASTHKLAVGPLDAASLFPLDSGVAIARLTYDGATDEGSVLRRSVGRRVVFRLPESKDTLSALVLGVDPLRLQLPDGRVTFQAPGAALYPADVIVADPTASLELRGSRAQERLRLGYFTAGASWRASYQVMLGSGTARVTGMAVLESQGLRAENADVQLLAGSVGRADKQPSPPPRPYDGLEARMVMEDATAVEQRVGEFHLYTLPGKSTLLPGLTTSVALFEPVGVPYERNYVVRGLVPYWGFLPQQGEETEAPVEVSYTLKRPHQSEFGDRPLPGGVARLYQADSAGRPQLVGEASLDHTPAGRDLRLDAGVAFDLTARRIQTSYATRRDSTKAYGIRTLAIADYRVTVRNATDSVATVDVIEERAGEWAVLSSSLPAEKLSSTRTRFRVKVPARGEAAVTYRLRIVW